MRRLITATAALTVLLASPAVATEPRLEARAILPADVTFAAPFNGVINTDPVFAPNSSQPVGGFSALLDAGGGELIRHAGQRVRQQGEFALVRALGSTA